MKSKYRVPIGQYSRLDSLKLEKSVQKTWQTLSDSLYPNAKAKANEACSHTWP